MIEESGIWFLDVRESSNHRRALEGWYTPEGLSKLLAITVTVDLLTTGIDVKKILNLVFLRRVKSRILYDQMIGCATRLCEDLYGRELDRLPKPRRGYIP